MGLKLLWDLKLGVNSMSEFHMTKE